MRRFASGYITALLVLMGAVGANAQPLPANSDMTVQVMKLSSGDWTTPVVAATARTDADGKLAFSLPAVPAADQSSFLLLQVVQNGTVLRQTVVPAPDKDGAVDAGISEVSDLQARALLAARSASGRTTPAHLLAALTLIRSSAISTADADRTGPALNAAADAFYAALARSTTPARIAAFDSALLAGLRRTMALYRKSVEDAVVADPTVEASGRGEAFALLMKELIDAAATSGIPLDAADGAYIAAGGAAETEMGRQSVSPEVVSLMRVGFMMGLIQCQTRQVVRGTSDALTAFGFPSPKLQRYYDYLNELVALTIRTGSENAVFTPTSLAVSDLELAVINQLAIHDIAWIHATMDFAGGFDPPALPDFSEFDALLSDVIARMAATSGVMNGMTAAQLASIMGTSESEPIGRKYLPAWYYLANMPNLTYTPIPDLSASLTSPSSPPLFDQLDGPYRALAQLQLDLALVTLLNSQDRNDAENLIATPQWLSFATVDQLKQQDQERRAQVRQRIGGITEAEKDAIIAIFYPTGVYY